MGVLKIWHMNPDVVDSQGMLQHVQGLLAQDNDAQVLGNCVTLLMQVQGVKRLSSNKVLVYTLINRIKVRRTAGRSSVSHHCCQAHVLVGVCETGKQQAAVARAYVLWQMPSTQQQCNGFRWKGWV